MTQGQAGGHNQRAEDAAMVVRVLVAVVAALLLALILPVPVAG